MTESRSTLPDCIETIKLGEKTIHLVGTAHVSKESVEDVRTGIAATKPDTICKDGTFLNHLILKINIPTNRDSIIRHYSFNIKHLNILRVLRDLRGVIFY